MDRRVAVKLGYLFMALVAVCSFGIAYGQQINRTQETGDGSLLFIGNVGQFDPAARFQVWGGGQTLWLAEDAIWVTYVEQDHAQSLDRADMVDPDRGEEDSPRGAAVRLSFPGSNPHPRLEPFGRQETVVSYFYGSDPAQWRAAVPVWGGVRYVDLYPGIDLVVGAGQARPALWQLEARSGADLSTVKMRVEGAENVVVDGAHLRITTTAGVASLPLLATEGPHAVPTVVGVGAQAFDVAAPFTARPAAHTVAQQERSSLSPADNPAELLYSTFLGGSSGESGNALAADGVGRVFMAGNTASNDFPTTPGAFDGAINDVTNVDAFVVRLNAAGSALEYATFLGGADTDVATSLAIDAAGQAYVAGDTSSDNFPTTSGAFDTTFGGDGRADAFVVKLDSDGSNLEYATFLGGSDNDWGNALAVDGNGFAYIAGDTVSDDFPTTPGALDTTFGGNWVDAFVVKLNSNGSALEYATFLGGALPERAYALAVGIGGQVYVTGYTESSDFPTSPDAFDTTHNGSMYYDRDAFVAVLNAVGNTLEYATFLGGSENDDARGLMIDAAGHIYVAGSTESSDFPTTAEAFDTTFSGGSVDGFVVKLLGSSLEYATFLGGSDDDGIYDIALDTAERAYVTGCTYSHDLPVTVRAFDTAYAGSGDAFVVRLVDDGSTVDYASYLGGSDSDSGNGIAVGGAGSAYVVGDTESGDFPITSGVFQPVIGDALSGGDAFASKLVMTNDDLPTPTPTATLTPTVTPTPAPTMVVNPPALDFGRVPISETMDLSLTVSNTGGSDLVIVDIDALAAPFHIASETCSGQSLPPGGACTIFVRFAPVTGNSGGDDYPPDAQPEIVEATCGGCVIVTSEYSFGFFVGYTAYFYVHNIGGPGSINVTVQADGYVEQRQFTVAGGARYTLKSYVRARQGGSHTIYASFPGLTLNHGVTALPSGNPASMLNRWADASIDIDVGSSIRQVPLYGVGTNATPTPTSTATATATHTPTPTSTPTSTPTATASPTSTPTPATPVPGGGNWLYLPVVTRQ